MILLLAGGRGVVLHMWKGCTNAVVFESLKHSTASDEMLTDIIGIMCLFGKNTSSLVAKNVISGLSESDEVSAIFEKNHKYVTTDGYFQSVAATFFTGRHHIKTRLKLVPKEFTQRK